MNILNTLISAEKLSLLWQGNNGFIMWDGKNMIATDLDLYNPERIIQPTADFGLLCQKLDALFITHEHEDHFNGETVKMLIADGHCKFIIPKSCEKKSRELKIPKNRLIFAQPGDKIKLPFVHAECIRALHGHLNGAVYHAASMLDCGYVFNFGGKRIFEPGDTVLLEEHSELENIDIMFVSPTEHNTKIKNSCIMINAISPAYIIPQHHSTYVEAAENLFWTHGYVDELFASLPVKFQRIFSVPNQKSIITI